MIDTIVLLISNLQPSDWIAVGSGGFAMLGSLFAFAFGLAARRSERRLRNLENQVSRIDRELVVWGSQCIETMSKGHMLLATEGSARQANEVRVLRDEIQSTLSALVDVGRLYFPNRSPDLEGLERPPANRGFRPAILDAVMLVHEELRHTSDFGKEDARRAANNVFQARRIFVSEFQEEIDRLRDKKVLDEIRVTDDNWTDISKLVDEYEVRTGKTFWPRRPRSRELLLAEWKAKQLHS